MEIRDILYKNNTINLEESSFFLAENDFFLNDLPVKKDSLVYYNKSTYELKVNFINYGLLKQGNIPDIVRGLMPVSENRLDYIVDRIGNCPKQINVLPRFGMGIWHDDHFDEWTGHFEDFLDNIKALPTLNYSGIEFSSLMYFCNASTGSLFYFINTAPIELNVNGAVFHLPEYLEISIHQYGKGATAITLQEIVYFDIKLQGELQLSETGILKGYCSEELSFDIIGHQEVNIITLPKGSQLEISNTGMIKTGIFNNRTHEVEYYEIKRTANN